MRLGDEPGKERSDGGARALGPWGVGGNGRGQVVGGGLDGAVVGAQEAVLLALKESVEAADADLGGGSEDLDGGGTVAAVGEDLGGGSEDVLAPMGVADPVGQLMTAGGRAAQAVGEGHRPCSAAAATKCSDPGRRGWEGPIGARGALRLRGWTRREERNPPRPGTAPVTATAPPDQGMPGCPCCRRPPGKRGDGNLLKP